MLKDTASEQHQETNKDIPIWTNKFNFTPRKVVPNISYELEKVGNYCVTPQQLLIDESIPECLSPPNDEVVNGVTEIGKREWISLNDDKWNLHKDFEYWKDPGPFDYTKSFYLWLGAGDESRGKLLHDADIVCTRTILSEMIETQFKSDVSWSVRVVRLPDSNTLLFYEECTSRQRDSQNEEIQRFLYYGTHFEFIMTGHSWRDSDRRRFVNVVNGQLGDLKILISGKVDATLTSSDGSQKDCVEFRTRTVQSKRKEHNWQKYKARSWWSTCFFIGTPTVIVGFYDGNNGQVKSVQELTTKEISRCSNKYWNQKECLSFVYEILNEIKKVSEKELDSPQKVLVCNCKSDATSRGRVQLSFEVYKRESSHYFFSEELLNNLINI